eukprot:XP_016663446.1 PREDICTED: putative nuclease HARBI1 isoform X2 [Acyrthosiphon pisum]
MDNFNDLAALYIMNMVDEEASYNPRHGFTVKYDPFTQCDRLFLKNYRLSKDLVQQLIALITPYIEPERRSSSIKLSEKVFLALNFFATGCYQTPIGNNRYVAVSQPTVSRAINCVVEALNHPRILNEWVKFPNNMQKIKQIRNEFFINTSFPGVVGCIDCTHIAIVPPNNQNAEIPEYIYVNRKGYHSLNVQLICDSKLYILSVNAKFPGSTADSHIWNSTTDIKNILEELYRREYKGIYLLGDSGYALRPWLLTPYSETTTNEEEKYNKMQMSTRSIIERCNGVLKARFS